MKWFKAKAKPVEAPPVARNKIPREPRLKVVQRRGISLALTEISGKTAELLNVSRSGVAFSLPENEACELGQKLNGAFSIGEETIPFRAEVVRKEGSVVAARFLGDATAIHKMVIEYFDVELHAQGLVLVRPDMLKSEPDGQPYFFRSSSVELFLVEDSSRVIVYFFLSFGEHYFEFGRGSPLRYGRVRSDTPKGVKYKGSEIIARAGAIPAQVCLDAIRLATNIEGLSAEKAEFLASVLEKRKN